MPRNAAMTVVEINSRTVRCGDVITVGGRNLRVADLISLSGGAKRLLFSTGEVLAIHTGTQLTAVRPIPIQPPRRNVWPVRYAGQPETDGPGERRR